VKSVLGEFSSGMSQMRSIHEWKACTVYLTFSEQDVVTSNLQIEFKIINRRQNQTIKTRKCALLKHSYKLRWLSYKSLSIVLGFAINFSEKN